MSLTRYDVPRGCEVATSRGSGSRLASNSSFAPPFECVLAIILVDLGLKRGKNLLDSNVDLGRPQSDPLHTGVSLTPVLPPMVALESSKHEAQARYRARNQEELRRKAREAMARRRALLQQSDTNQAHYAAREEAARYRAKNRDILAQKARVRRARNSIDKIGYEKWVAKYRKRHSGPIPAILESEYSSPSRDSLKDVSVDPASAPSISPAPRALPQPH
ncbi:hypothetical protein B0H14DRAFT_2616018 [Mycena olivaceomarginata]|nr:hypothetical protein B0H14DRAFT_2616018 [Mycena olivaceomarginata]